MQAGVDACVCVGDELIRDATRMLYHNTSGRVLAGDSGSAGLAGCVALAKGGGCGDGSDGVRGIGHDPRKRRACD